MSYARKKVEEMEESLQQLRLRSNELAEKNERSPGGAA